MNWEKLCPSLSFTAENKIGNLNKIKLVTFQTQWVRYPITSNFKNLPVSWVKYVSGRKIKFWTHHELERPWMKILTVWCIIQEGKQWKHVNYTFTFKTMISWGTRSSFYINFNVFSIMRNDFGHVLIYWWVGLFIKTS